MATSYGTHNEPQWATTATPAIAADLTALGAYAATVGNRRVGASTVRTGLAGSDLWEGLEFCETDTGITYIYHSSAWVVQTVRAGGSVKRSNGTATFSATTWTPLTNTAYWAADQAVTGGLAAFNGTWVAPLAGLYDVRLGIQLDSTVTAILALKKNDNTGSSTGNIGAASGTGLASFTALSVSKLIRLNVGDYVAGALYPSAAAVWNTTAPDASFFSIRYVEPLR